MAVALIVFGFGWLNLFHALAPEHSLRRKLLAVFFWVLWPAETLIFFSGRRARQDRDTHIIYASLIIALGTLMLVMALFF
jgi:hypothetical protein